MVRPGLVGKVYRRRQFSGASLTVAEAVAIGKNHSGSGRQAPVRVPWHSQGHSPTPSTGQEVAYLFGSERKRSRTSAGTFATFNFTKSLYEARPGSARLLSVIPDAVGRLFFNGGGHASATQRDCSGTIALTLPVTDSGQQLSLHFSRTGTEIIRPNVRAKDHTGDKGLTDLGDPLAVGL
jgi:hypothetical protein